MKRYKQLREYGFIHQYTRLSKLSQVGNPLEKLKNGIDFELFVNFIEDSLQKSTKENDGGPFTMTRCCWS